MLFSNYDTSCQAVCCVAVCTISWKFVERAFGIVSSWLSCHLVLKFSICKIIAFQEMSGSRHGSESHMSTSSVGDINSMPASPASTFSTVSTCYIVGACRRFLWIRCCLIFFIYTGYVKL